jgi:hypothetical protein
MHIPGEADRLPLLPWQRAPVVPPADIGEVGKTVDEIFDRTAEPTAAENDATLHHIYPAYDTARYYTSAEIRHPAPACNCLGGEHTGRLEIIKDTSRHVGAVLMAYVPFPLLQTSDAPGCVDGFDAALDTLVRKRKPTALRLGYILYDKPGVDGLELTERSATLLTGAEYRPVYSRKLFQSALRFAGCPDFTFE